MKNFFKSSQDLTRLVRYLKIQWRRIARRRAVRAYLSSPVVKKLHIGCGGNLLPGWLNTDSFPQNGAVFLDAGEIYPFPDNSFDYVFSEHTIEHIQYRQALTMLRQCHRVLKPGGRIRLVTPDLRVYAGFLKSELSPIERDCVNHFFNDWIKTGFSYAKDYQPISDQYPAIFVLNDIFRNYEHRFIYDDQTLAELVKAAGFQMVEQAVTGKSSDPNLSGLETHNNEINSFVNLVVEARK